MHKNNCATLTTSYNFNISYSLTCSKTWGKGPKRLKVLEIDHFLYVRALLDAEQDHKVKENTTGNANIGYTPLSFHAILIPVAL